MMRRGAAILAVLLAAAGALTFSDADAAAGHHQRFPIDHTVVVNRSIGGVRLGERWSQAKDLFPAAHSCDSSLCAAGDRQGDSVFVERGPHSRVGAVTIVSGPRHHTPFHALRTNRGIGFGSSIAAVRRAYPHGRLDTVRGGQYYALVTRGASTTFAFADRRVVTITVNSPQPGRP